MRNHNPYVLMTCSMLVLSAVIASSQPATVPNATDLAERQVTAYLARLADLHCNESVTQEKLAPNGHVDIKDQAKYDYLIMMNGNGDDFQLNESRIESSASRSKPLPMLVTNGFSTMLLVFHPYYRESFQFNVGADEAIDGKPAIPVHFSHITGRRTPAALALRGREYPLELQGTAWLDKQSGEIVKIESSLQRDMSDIGLRSLNIRVEYKPTDLGKGSKTMTLPALAVVDVTTPKQHWRNMHAFDGYKSFSTDAVQEPNVKIRAGNATPSSDTTVAVVHPN